jgi:hypothetical protein
LQEFSDQSFSFIADKVIDGLDGLGVLRKVNGFDVRLEVLDDGLLVGCLDRDCVIDVEFCGWK